MTERVTLAPDIDPRLLRLPPPVHWGFGLEPGIDTEVVQQAIGLEPQKVVGIELPCRRKGTGKQTDRGQLEGPERWAGCRPDILPRGAERHWAKHWHCHKSLQHITPAGSRLGVARV